MSSLLSRFARKTAPVVVLASASACAMLSNNQTDEETEAAAWGYRGRPTNVFLSEHGIGSRDESLAYYSFFMPPGESLATYTLAKWKRDNLGAATTRSAFYRNTTELGFWREMTCTTSITRGVGGCTVTNWNSPNEPASGSPNQGTVAMSLSPQGFVRFYVFLPDGKLSPSAVLDAEGPKFVPRLCTVCHSGADPRPGTNPDVGAVFREFEIPLLEGRPGLPRQTAEQQWQQLNQIARQANTQIRKDVEGSPVGTDHARLGIQTRIDVLNSSPANLDPPPASWVAAGSEAAGLWTKMLAPYCMSCHRHNDLDWTNYQNFKYLQGGAIKNHLPSAPDPSAQVGAMPQAALTFNLLKNDRPALDAVSRWLGAVACGGGCPAPANGTATCQSTGLCLVSCNVGFDACQSGCCRVLNSGDDITIGSGADHSCAVTQGSTVSGAGPIKCWGDNDLQQATPPTGDFFTVSTGGAHSCGVRANGTVECWGSNGFDQARAPLGTFRAVSAGVAHSCGVRTDGTLACWGSNRFHQSDAPSGIFRSVSAGGSFSCGIRADETIQCWGAGPDRDVPTGAFLSVSVNTDSNRPYACGVRTDESVACWGATAAFVGIDPPAGAFRALSVGTDHACGVRTDGWIACWGANESGKATPQAGTFRAISAGGRHSCGTRTNGTLACWGDDDDRRATPPPGSFL